MLFYLFNCFLQRELNTDVYFVSEDLQYILIAYQIESVSRDDTIMIKKINHLYYPNNIIKHKQIV